MNLIYRGTTVVQMRRKQRNLPTDDIQRITVLTKDRDTAIEAAKTAYPTWRVDRVSTVSPDALEVADD